MIYIYLIYQLTMQPSDNQQSDKQQSDNQRSDESAPVVYDDELDENFEDNFEKTATTSEMKTTLNSFDNPLGLEESPESSVMDGPQLDQKEIERFRKQVMNMPKNELTKLFQNIATQNNLGLGENNFRSVNGDHRNDIKNKLRQKLNQRIMARKPKDVRTREIERREASLRELKKKDNIDQLNTNQQPDEKNINALLENLSNAMDENNDNNHNHDANCNHSHDHNDHSHSANCDHSHNAINYNDSPGFGITPEEVREMTTNNLDQPMNNGVVKSELTKKQLKQLTKKQEKTQVKTKSFNDAKAAIKQNSDVMSRSSSEQHSKSKSRSRSDKTKQID
jgi:hypothetical protein